MPDPFAASSIPLWAFIIMASFWGAVWGSFATVIIWRFPRDESIVRPSSHCPVCLAPIRWYDNIPLLSFLLLLGRCRRCGVRISPLYPAVEGASLLLAQVALHLTYDPHAHLAIFLGRFVVTFTFFWALFVVSLIDLMHFLIPDIITLPGIVLFLGYTFILSRHEAFTTALSVVGAYLLVAVGFNLLYRVLAGVEGMGMGDAKFLAMIAAMTGWEGALFALVAGAAQGLAVNTPLLLLKRRRKLTAGAGKTPSQSLLRSEVPFGPLLALGAFEYVLWGERIIAIYLRLADSLASLALG